MKRLVSRLASVVFFAFFASLMFMQNAHAYLDPAAATYIVQILSGIVIGGAVAVGIFWKKIRLFFRNISMKRLEKKLEKKGEERGS